ncbi:MAG: hypothetical protein LC800_18500 [Acidobacteria bacterium]|nr:hypothetical protein [Acidobacteriota bacterium]
MIAPSARRTLHAQSQPHDGAAPRVERGDAPGALADAGHVLAVPQRVGREDRQQREDAEREQDAVEEEHE